MGHLGQPGRPGRGLIVALAEGALLISAVLELIEPASHVASFGAVSVLVLAGAVMFAALDHLIKERGGGDSGGGPLAAITLDGIPENLALGVALTSTGALALSGSILLFTFPEAAGGAREMTTGGRSERAALDGASTSDSAGALVDRLTAPRPDAEPELDKELARWDSPVLVAPRLTLLGPITVRTMGDATATAHRRPYYSEFLAYLALHLKVVSADKLAEDLCIRPQKAPSDLSVLRRWLGHNRSGEPYLPRAQQTHQDGVPATYALDGAPHRSRPLPPAPRPRPESRRRGRARHRRRRRSRRPDAE